MVYEFATPRTEMSRQAQDPLRFRSKVRERNRDVPVDFNMLVIMVGRVANQAIGSQQTAETVPVRAWRWHAVALIDDKTG